jgi:dienelactone hydrolase
MRPGVARAFSLGLLLAGLLAGGHPATAAGGEPETVRFPSADGKTSLVGYLFAPSGDAARPAIVLLHGRGGPYSTLARGVYSAATLSQRHASWGRFWASHGYTALLVDSFGPRGYHAGFPRGSYATRPAEVSEQTARPLDAYGALAYLRSRSDVLADRVGLQGWSNGAMTALVAMSDAGDAGLARPTRASGFRAALALYPGCRMERVRGRYVPYAPLLLLLASDDDEVSPTVCVALATRSRAAGAPLDVVVYEGAEHGFDDPGQAKQRRAANRRAADDARARAGRFFAEHLGPGAAPAEPPK